MTAASKLDGIKPGDQVKYTGMADVVCFGDGVLTLRCVGTGLTWPISWRVYDLDTFQIERIEQPLAVGDRVRIRGRDAEYEVLRIVGHQAVILTVTGDPFADIYPTSDLERIP